MKILFYLILLFLSHFCIINGLEKLLFQIFLYNNDNILRPLQECKSLKNTPTKCLGMPSGHTEITTFIAYILYNYNYISLPDLFIIIGLMCLQRIITKRHTSIQTLIGITSGLMYSNIYLGVGITYKSVLVSICIIFIYIYVLNLKINTQLYKKIPDWVDKSMIDSINKKRTVPYYLKFTSILFTSFQQDRFLFMGWKDLEFYLDKIIENIKNTNIQYDAIVGIKTGGAIISNYISQKLNIQNYKIKISDKKYNCNKNPSDFFNNYIQLYIKKNNTKYIICEGIDDTLNGKNIILIDELVSSGKTMNTAIKYLTSKNINNIYPTTIISSNYVKLINNYKLNTILSSEYMNSIWPWGYDN